ncbi:MAG: BrnT family toxin [Thermomicrobiales bacterium]|nr:BrnT family toxin [Thermomicrobiales bacterium]
MAGTTGHQYYRVGALLVNGFEWDDAKAESNIGKHDIVFEVAIMLFRDRNRIEQDPPQQRQGEVRWKTVGRAEGALTTVIYTWRGDRVRIISARKASRYERREYRSRAIV